MYYCFSCLLLADYRKYLVDQSWGLPVCQVRRSFKKTQLILKISVKLALAYVSSSLIQSNALKIITLKPFKLSLNILHPCLPTMIYCFWILNYFSIFSAKVWAILYADIIFLFRHSNVTSTNTLICNFKWHCSNYLKDLRSMY